MNDAIHVLVSSAWHWLSVLSRYSSSSSKSSVFHVLRANECLRRNCSLPRPYGLFKRIVIFQDKVAAHQAKTVIKMKIILTDRWILTDISRDTGSFSDGISKLIPPYTMRRSWFGEVASSTGKHQYAITSIFFWVKHVRAIKKGVRVLYSFDLEGELSFHTILDRI